MTDSKSNINSNSLLSIVENIVSTFLSSSSSDNIKNAVAEFKKGSVQLLQCAIDYELGRFPNLSPDEKTFIENEIMNALSSGAIRNFFSRFCCCCSKRTVKPKTQ